MSSFPERLYAIQQAKNTRLALIFTPKIAMMPLPIQRYDDPFLPFGKTIISATHDLVCAYLFDLAAYLAIGAAGAVALERTIAFAKAGGDVLAILHGFFATADYVDMAGAGGFNVDAATVLRFGSQSEVLQAYSTALNEGVIFKEYGYSGVHPPQIPTVSMFDDTMQKITVFGRKIPGFVTEIRLLGDEVLYAGRGDDFDAQVRAALEAKQNA